MADKKRKKILAFWIVKKHKVFARMAEVLGRPYLNVNVQLRRGKPKGSDRIAISDALSQVLGIDPISETLLFSEFSETEATRFIQTLHGGE